MDFDDGIGDPQLTGKLNMRTTRTGRRTSRRGSALMVMTFMVVGMLGATYALLQTTLAGHLEQRRERGSMHSRYVCQAGLAQAMVELRRGQSGVLGSLAAPLTWGGGTYYVTRTNLSADLVSLVATGTDDRSTSRMELVVRSVPSTIWRFGAFGKEAFHMDSNSRVDSYDSGLGTYASQATNGSGTNIHARVDGDVGSNGHVHLDQNGKVWGDALAGPGHSTTVLGNAFVTGSTTPMPVPLTLPELVLPSYASLGALTVSANTTVAAGNRAYSNLTVNNNKTLTINGPANVVVTNLRLRSGGALRVDTSGGPVNLWVIDNFIMDSNSLMAPLNNLPQDLHVNLLSDNVIDPEVTIQLDEIDFASNTKMYGTMYAPSAAITIKSNFEFFGSLIARSVDLNSNATIHFDEALIDAMAAGDPTFETVCWREIAMPSL